jgi:Na+/H+ antiporter NhaD/arsenite permease-like protein
MILAAVAVVGVAIWPTRRLSAAIALTAGLLSTLVAGWSVAEDALRATGPMLIFLTAAIGVAALAERRGLAERAATVLVRAGQGRTKRLYALTCLTSATLTCVVSLDGAVVLMVPLVRALGRRCQVSVTPFFLGSVAVANAASLAVPEGNPTNLVVMSRLGVSPLAFLAHLLLPGLVATLLCALVPLRLLKPPRDVIESPGGPASVVPWRIGAQMAGLLAALDGLAPALSLHTSRFAALLAVAGGTAAAAATANNLPVSASVAALATSGPGVYAALIGLTVGALATAHGSVATLIARDLAAEHRPWARTWAPAAAVAVLLSTFLLWLTFSVG